MQFIRTQKMGKRADKYVAFLIPIDQATIGKPGDLFHIFKDEKTGQYVVQHAGGITPPEAFIGRRES